MKNTMRFFMAVCLLLVYGQAWAIDLPADKAQCLALCDQYYPGGGTADPGKSKVFPGPITFERSSDQGNGAAAILFRSTKDNWINFVSVNGEIARKGVSYKGASVFLLTKSGDKYPRPLKFVIKTVDGGIYTAVSGSSTSADTGDPAVGSYKYKKTYPRYNVANDRNAWRIPENGPWFGKQAKVVFANGKSFTVYDTSKNCRDQEKTCSRNFKAAMYGFVWKSGLGPNGTGDENTGTSHHGVYIHEPFGGTSKSLTIYYNGK